ncbi:hypothetical protein C5L31_001987 [Secundilactobacillus malefermentans]|uniref:Uncharacterized protein n=1 Tax=Secundilactobacillus malefermentans TaxID=176292 RepID=A0A4R5NGH4_9LACO|nr:hypothetical protein [Secundilactobacillus malefermentans]TDG73225.1 hypothetical protein C5L31_001987 [Secundilactobacillus malefermentans]
MKSLVKYLFVMIAAISFGVCVTSVGQVNASSTKTHKVKSVPKVYRGTWYYKSGGKTYKFKVSSKKWDISKYNSNPVKNTTMSAMSERYFSPRTVTGSKIKKNTLILVNGMGVQTIRRTTLKKHAVLMVYNQQEHSSRFTIATKVKNSSLQKHYMGSNPYGMGVTSVKTAKQNRSFHNKMNQSIKKYFGAALQKKTMKGFSIFKGINITYYDNYRYVR